MPGRHNALNATAAVAIAHQLEIAPDKIADGPQQFPWRRSPLPAFAARPAALPWSTTTATTPPRFAPLWPPHASAAHGRVHVVFQPHRYTRTRDLIDEFSGAFTDADTVIVLPIYAASEEPIPGVTAELLTSKITSPQAQFAPDFAAAIAAVAGSADKGDLILRWCRAA